MVSIVREDKAFERNNQKKNKLKIFFLFGNGKKWQIKNIIQQKSRWDINGIEKNSEDNEKVALENEIKNKNEKYI